MSPDGTRILVPLGTRPEIVKLAPTLKRSQAILVNLSGRGDKDVHQIARLKGAAL